MKNKYWYLIGTIVLTTMLIVCFFLPKPTKSPRVIAEEKAIEKDRIEAIASSIEYFREPRSGLCFAHRVYALGNAYGGRGESLATVPCDKIEKLLPESQR